MNAYVLDLYEFEWNDDERFCLVTIVDLFRVWVGRMSVPVAPALHPVKMDNCWSILDLPENARYRFPQKSLAALRTMWQGLPGCQRRAHMRQSRRRTTPRA